MAVIKELTRPANQRTNLVTHAFQSASWAMGENLIVAHGVIGWVEEINEVARRVVDLLDGNVDAYDTFDSVDESILRSLRLDPVTHRRSPPTMHQRVRLHFAWPDDWPGPPEFMICASDRLPQVPVDGTVLVGKFDLLQALAERDNLAYYVIGHWCDIVAVRAHAQPQT